MMHALRPLAASPSTAMSLLPTCGRWLQQRLRIALLTVCSLLSLALAHCSAAEPPAVPPVLGAHGVLFPTSAAASAEAAAGEASSAGAGRWSWSYLDPTPSAATIASVAGSRGEAVEAFPFQYGVADRDPRDREGSRFIPAIRYAHVAVATQTEMIVSHGSVQLEIDRSWHCASSGICI